MKKCNMKSGTLVVERNLGWRVNVGTDDTVQRDENRKGKEP